MGGILYIADDQRNKVVVVEFPIMQTASSSLEDHAKTPSEPDPHFRPHKSLTHHEMYFHFLPQVDPDTNSRCTGFTVFFRKEDNGHWHGAVARCNPLDQFSRRKGRQIAHRRYFQERNSGKQLPTFGTDRPTYQTAQDFLIRLLVPITLMAAQTISEMPPII